MSEVREKEMGIGKDQTSNVEEQKTRKNESADEMETTGINARK